MAFGGRIITGLYTASVACELRRAVKSSYAVVSRMDIYIYIVLHLFVCIYAHDGSIGLWESTPQDMGPFQHYILREESERERERARDRQREGHGQGQGA